MRSPAAGARDPRLAPIRGADPPNGWRDLSPPQPKGAGGGGLSMGGGHCLARAPKGFPTPALPYCGEYSTAKGEGSLAVATGFFF
ncbi:hypothetical protein NL676_028587 [Syzygium grande]|nr:hypothetical protein NL676_028587 [Syzygium grande]